MIEIPGFQPTGVHARLGGPGPWPEVGSLDYLKQYIYIY